MYDATTQSQPSPSSDVVSIFSAWQAVRAAWIVASDADENSAETLNLWQESTRLLNDLWQTEAKTAEDVAALARAFWINFGPGWLPGTPDYRKALEAPETRALESVYVAAVKVAGLPDGIFEQDADL